MIDDRIEFYKWKAGYSAEQSTPPRRRSAIRWSIQPVGLASWIYERFLRLDRP